MVEVVAEFHECQDCKVDARLMQSIADGMIEKGNADVGSLGAVRTEIYSIVNPTKPPIAGARIPSARVSWDICTKCGRTFTVKIEKGHMTMPLAPGGQPTFS